MSGQVTYGEVEAGAELPAASYPVTRLSLVKYCGASGDFNFIHWNDRIARAVGLPDVIEVTGQIEDKLDDNRVAIALTARSAGDKVLTRARAVVRLP
jgi:hypothetical protein